MKKKILKNIKRKQKKIDTNLLLMKKSKKIYIIFNKKCN